MSPLPRESCPFCKTSSRSFRASAPSSMPSSVLSAPGHCACACACAPNLCISLSLSLCVCVCVCVCECVFELRVYIPICVYLYAWMAVDGVEEVSIVWLPCMHQTHERDEFVRLERCATLYAPTSLARSHACVRARAQHTRRKKKRKNSRKYLSTQQRSVEIYAAADCVAGRHAAAPGVR